MPDEQTPAQKLEAEIEALGLDAQQAVLYRDFARYERRAQERGAGLEVEMIQQARRFFVEVCAVRKLPEAEWKVLADGLRTQISAKENSLQKLSASLNETLADNDELKAELQKSVAYLQKALEEKGAVELELRAANEQIEELKTAAARQQELLAQVKVKQAEAQAAPAGASVASDAAAP